MLSQPTSLIELNIDRIIVDNRYRRDLGYISQLAQSISEVGLIHPVVITTEFKLVAGQRRLQARRLFGCTTIMCCVVENLQEALPLLQAELAENTCRKRFLPSEPVSAAEALLPMAQEAAKQRQGAVSAKPTTYFSLRMDRKRSLQDNRRQEQREDYRTSPVTHPRAPTSRADN